MQQNARRNAYLDGLLAERDSQQTGAQQHEAGRGQREESLGHKVMISHDTPAVSMLVRIH